MSTTQLSDIVRRVARDDGGRDAVVEGTLRSSYRDIADAIDETADALRASGLKAGARVAFMGYPGTAFIVSHLATQRAGGVWTGLDARYSTRELAHVLTDCAASLVIVEARVGEEAQERVRQAVVLVDPVPPVMVVVSHAELIAVPQKLPSPRAALSPYIGLVVYTSGTTGTPKGACLTHRGILEAARLYADRYAHPELRSLLNLPVNHVGSLIDLTASAIAMGGTLVTMPGFDPAAIPTLMRAERISILGQVPAMHLAIDAVAPHEIEDMPHLRHLVWSGAAMPRSWIAARHGRGVELSTCYGQTEITGAVTFTTPDADVDTLADAIGRPAHAGLVRVVNEGGGICVLDEPGELQVTGPVLMDGYLGRADATAETITPEGWLKTGDLAVTLPSGDLRLVGRLKEMYKSGGFNVYPREVETVLEAHPAVAAAAVVTMPDPRWQEVGWAFVIARSPVDAAELESFARERLANYKLPKRFVIRDELPLLPIGKIDKRGLKALAAEGAID